MTSGKWLQIFQAMALLLVGSALPAKAPLVARADTTNLVYLPNIHSRLTTGLGTVTGVVYDASFRTPLENAQVCYSTSCALTNSQGQYTLANIPSGWRVLTASETAHFALSEGLYVLGQTVNVQDFSLPEVSTSGDIYIRIVLNWDSTISWPPYYVPNDLDANLWLDGTIPERITSWSEGDCTTYPNSCLEIDVQDGYGPETIAVRKLENGDYSYAVLNVNAAYEGVPSITQLDAVVRVYDEFGLIHEFQVPGQGVGDLWYVFSMSPDGVIHPQNCITSEPPVNELPVCPP
jgi:hypothetical protein